MKKALKITLYVAAALAVAYYFLFALPFRGVPFNKQRHGQLPLTPAWALEPWLWEDDVNTAAFVDELLEGYKAHDLPLRTIMLDSPWSYRYNDFDVDTLLYPEPEKWFKKLQDDGYRVVLWMTPNVNSYNKGLRISDSEEWYLETREKGYLMGGKQENKWWKGKGGFIDYSNPEAMEWWRGLQQRVFNLGIDGWKLDGSATMCWTNVGPLPLFYKKSHSGIMTTRKYMDHYYRDEYYHGLKQNPEFVTLARSIDRGFHPEGFAPFDAAPVTWVGDQRHSWVSGGDTSGEDTVDIALDGIEGIEMAMENIIEAAERGYCIIGSDIAGFSGRIIPPRLYIRWTQFSTFCGLFLNGGHGERRLWKRTPQELEIIREYSWLHQELIPYMYSYVVQAHHGGKVLQTPVKGKYHYLFGDHLLVAPIYKDELVNEVNLPEGKWRYWFDDQEVIEGPANFSKEFPLDEYPVYIKEGAIVPMNISRDYTGIGSKEDEDYLTVLIYPEGESTFSVYDTENQEETAITVSESPDQITVSLSGKKLPHILKIKIDQPPGEVTCDGMTLLPEKDFIFEPGKNMLRIKKDQYSQGTYLIKNIEL